MVTLSRYTPLARTRRPRPRTHNGAMIHSLSIANYRGFSHFEMNGLGRVNLLVGTNNSGKTSILEALYLLASGGDANAIWRIVARRGERMYLETPSRQPEIEYEVSHLFYHHEVKVGASFSVSTKNESPTRSIKFAVVEASQEEGKKRGETSVPPPIFLVSSGPHHQQQNVIPLTRRGGLRSEALEAPARRVTTRRAGIPDTEPAVQYITTESLSMGELSVMWNQVALTEAENRVVRALRFLEPKVERLAPITTSQFPFMYDFPMQRGGFIVKLTDVEQPIPIGSLGDGTWRMLALAIALSRAKDGVLLVDEIDTGLHYTVMADMWRLISETAKALNVQVFATTHSYDCVHSLSAICNSQEDHGHEVTLQRIDLSKKKTIPFAEDEIKIAAERKIEVR
jgi:predicted ATPase